MIVTRMLYGQFLEALSGKYTSMLTSNLSKNFMIYSSSNANCYCVQTSLLNKRTRKILHITVLKIPYISYKCVLILSTCRSKVPRPLQFCSYKALFVLQCSSATSLREHPGFSALVLPEIRLRFAGYSATGIP